MNAAGNRRTVASATRLLAVVLGLILGLSLIAVGSQVGVGLTVEGTALRDCVAGPLASNHDNPEQPPPRLIDTELQEQEDSEDDSDDDRIEYAQVDHALHELGGQTIGRVAFDERRRELGQRIRAGHGARGPPLA